MVYQSLILNLIDLLAFFRNRIILVKFHSYFAFGNDLVVRGPNMIEKRVPDQLFCWRSEIWINFQHLREQLDEVWAAILKFLGQAFFKGWRILLSHVIFQVLKLLPFHNLIQVVKGILGVDEAEILWYIKVWVLLKNFEDLVTVVNHWLLRVVEWRDRVARVPHEEGFVLQLAWACQGG